MITNLPHSPDPFTHDLTSASEQITTDTTANNTAPIEQVLSSAHPPFARRGTILPQGVVAVLPGLFPSKVEDKSTNPIEPLVAPREQIVPGEVSEAMQSGGTWNSE